MLKFEGVPVKPRTKGKGREWNGINGMVDLHYCNRCTTFLPSTSRAIPYSILQGSYMPVHTVCSTQYCKSAPHQWTKKQYTKAQVVMKRAVLSIMRPKYDFPSSTARMVL